MERPAGGARREAADRRGHARDPAPASCCASPARTSSTRTSGSTRSSGSDGVGRDRARAWRGPRPPARTIFRAGAAAVHREDRRRPPRRRDGARRRPPGPCAGAGHVARRLPVLRPRVRLRRRRDPGHLDRGARPRRPTSTRVARTIADRRLPAVFVESSVPRQTIDAVLAAARARGQEARLGGELFSDAAGEDGRWTSMLVANAQRIAKGACEPMTHAARPGGPPPHRLLRRPPGAVGRRRRVPRRRAVGDRRAQRRRQVDAAARRPRAACPPTPARRSCRGGRRAPRSTVSPTCPSATPSTGTSRSPSARSSRWAATAQTGWIRRVGRQDRDKADGGAGARRA